MFSIIPMPRIGWDQTGMRYVLWAFPLVGFVCATSWYLIFLIPLPDLLRGTALFLAPLLLTGGIHLDGYLDVYDALACHGSVEDLQRVLRDPHCGAFALIRFGMYCVATEALCVTLRLTPAALGCLGATFVLSRALSAWSLASRPLAEGSSLARQFIREADRTRLRWFSTLIIVGMGIVQALCAGWIGCAAFAAALVTTAWCLSVAHRRFGGLSGDLCGWLLIKVEFWSLLTFVLLQGWFA